MAESIPPEATKAKRLETASAEELAEMIIHRECLAEGIKALKLYFAKLKGNDQPTDEDDATIRTALFRDGIVQVMACFTTNASKRDRYLLPSEAFAGIEGWGDMYKWMHEYRDGYAAHNFGPRRMAEAVVMLDRETNDVVGVGDFSLITVGEGIEAEKSIAQFCMAALRHCEARIADLRDRLMAEAKAMSPEERAALLDARLQVPEHSDAKISRQKHRMKTKARQQAEEAVTK